MSTTESLASDLARLSQALGDPDVDLEVELQAFIAAAKLAVDSYLGMSLRIGAGVGQVNVSVYEHERGVTRVVTSLLIPPLASSGQERGATLTMYAARPGAFVDLAADLSYALGLDHSVLKLDQDLEPDRAAVATDLDKHATINQAIGVLLDHGHTAETAAAELRRLAEIAASDLHTVAEEVVRDVRPHRAAES